MSAVVTVACALVSATILVILIAVVVEFMLGRRDRERRWQGRAVADDAAAMADTAGVTRVCPWCQRSVTLDGGSADA